MPGHKAEIGFRQVPYRRRLRGFPDACMPEELAPLLQAA